MDAKLAWSVLEHPSVCCSFPVLLGVQGAWPGCFAAAREREGGVDSSPKHLGASGNGIRLWKLSGFFFLFFFFLLST